MHEKKELIHIEAVFTSTDEMPSFFDVNELRAHSGGLC